MKFLKKVTICFMAATLILTMCACGTEKTPESAPTPEVVYVEPPAETPVDTPAQTPLVIPTLPPAPSAVPATPAPTPVPAPTPTPTPTATPAPTHTPVQKPVVAPQPNDTSLYNGVIETHRQALQGYWSGEQCEANGINRLVANYSAYGNAGVLGYCFMDVDGNGADELLIGDGKLILTMYTQVSGSVVKVFDGWERNSYYLEPDMLIVNFGSNSAFQSGYVFWYLGGCSLVFKGALICDYDVNYSEPWFYDYDNDWNVRTNADKVSNKTAKQWIDAYEGSYMQLPYTPFL